MGLLAELVSLAALWKVSLLVEHWGLRGQMSYPEKLGQFRARFKTKDLADAYEAHIRAFGQEPDWAHTAHLEGLRYAVEELRSSVEKLSENLRVAEERGEAALARIGKLEKELSLARLATSPSPEVAEWQEFMDTVMAGPQAEGPCGEAGARPKTLPSASPSDVPPVPPPQSPSEADEEISTEPMYRIFPSSGPHRFNDCYANYRARSPDELAMAEAILRNLNFTREDSNNIITHTLYHERFIVLADPRMNGIIEFCVFTSEQAAQLKEHKRRTCRTERFGVVDYPQCVPEIPRTFKRLLSEACRVLAKRDEAARNKLKERNERPKRIKG